ncbi:hypothetical protein AN958_12046 [Leucoagaricus sp. SymC.cos]|nr:hypothetical protein AN958_12046 [Leucoagaricus sp. SymC.cos]
MAIPLVFDPEARYVTSYLLKPATLGSTRLSLGIHALVTNLVILIWSGVASDQSGTYFSYFTHLSYIGVTAWFWASGVQTFAFARNRKNEDDARYPLQSWPKPLQILHELLFSTIATFPFVVTIVYWALLASSDSFSSPYLAWSNISQHILNSVFVLFELVFTDLPTLPWIYLPATIVLLGLYLGVAYITSSTQGFYAYTFLDPKKQGALLAGYIIGIAVGQAILFIIVHYAILLRIRLVGSKHRAPQHNHDEEKTVP